MNLTPDDPRLTAYALDEIDDPNERNAIKKAIDTDPALQREVANIRATAAELSTLLGQEPAPAVDTDSLLPQEPTHTTNANTGSKLIPFLRKAALPLAACFVGALLIYSLEFRSIENYGDTPATQAAPPELNDETQADPAYTEHRISLQPNGATATSSIPPETLERRVDAKRYTKTGDTKPPEIAVTVPSTTTAKPTHTHLLVQPPQLAQPKVAVNPTPGDGKIESEQLGLGMAYTVVEPQKLEYKVKMKQQKKASSAPRLKVVTYGSKNYFHEPTTVTPGGAINHDTLAEGAYGISSFDEGGESRLLLSEGYDALTDNPWASPYEAPLSTFSLDVDTASMSNVRRMLENNQLPPADAVRIEELVNYFRYDYAQPENDAPVAASASLAPAPWNPQHRLMRIAVQAETIDSSERPPANFVFLIDVSGSMNSPNKLPLVKESLAMLLRRLDDRDRVAIVTYAGSSGIALKPTSASEPETISAAIDRLSPRGGTNGADGIRTAYDLADSYFIKNGNNRVLLCTDGDFNVGTTDRDALLELIGNNAKRGIQLTILGYGMGNLQDGNLEALSNRGDGNYAYIDNAREARKVLVEDALGTLQTIARDVKVQVEFNPAHVQAYRLIGYANRMLAAEDFNDDTKDAGDLGVGHTVTALYEIVPVGAESQEAAPPVDDLKYQSAKNTTAPKREPVEITDTQRKNPEIATLKLRYKRLTAESSERTDQPVYDKHFYAMGERAFVTDADTDFQFAAAVAAFGMKLRGHDSVSGYEWDRILRLAEGALGVDSGGHRSSFIPMIEKAQRLSE